MKHNVVSGHKVVIQERLFWRFKQYRYHCTSCGDTGKWYKHISIPNEQGWYHDDVSIFELLLRGRSSPEDN